MYQTADSHVYSGLMIPAQMLRLFASAARFYADVLANDLETFQLDEELAKLLDERTLRSFNVTRDIQEAKDIAERAEKLIPQAESMGDVTMALSHRYVRLLKALCLLYIGELESRRNATAVRHGATAKILDVLDTKLLELRELLEKGVFGRAEPLPLLVAAEAAERPARTAELVTITSTSRVASIDIVDEELRTRCLDLFNDFVEMNHAERFDTIVVEATRILEDRVRKTARLGSASSGVDLISAAFGGKAPRLRVSEHAGEQEGVYHLFRGVIGFIRNPVHHRLQNVPKERAIQVLGLIDYLLHVAETADTVTA